MSVFAFQDAVVTNPHYVACMLLEEGSWEWWLKGCFVYSSSASSDVIAMGLSAVVAILSSVGLRAWLFGGRW